MHPKMVHYPQSRDYVFSHTFRPFVTFIHPPNYRSKAVNTDGFGVREQYDAEGRFIDLRTARDSYPSCNLLLGGSTAFGVGASSDRATIAAHLNEPGRPCLNLAVRAGSARQELAMFLALKHLLPPVNAVILLSGVNECILAASEKAHVYPGYGAAFAEHVRGLQDEALEQALGTDHAPPWAHSALDRLARSPKALRRRPTAVVDAPVAPRDEPPSLTFDERLDLLLALAADTLETWSWFQSALGLRAYYVLQPLATWMARPLTAIEQECVDADRVAIAALATFGQPAVYVRARDAFQAACEQTKIPFHDANRWFEEGGLDNVETFVDVAHLTDTANAYLAARLREELDCWSPE